MMEEKDYELVVAKIPKVNDSGRDVSGDAFGAGGKRSEDGKISALAYDFEPYDEEEENAESEELSSYSDDNFSYEEQVVAQVIKLAIALALGYVVGKYSDEIVVGMHKANRWVKTTVLKKQISEEEIFSDDLRLLVKHVEKIENMNHKITEGDKKRNPKYDKAITISIEKLSKLIDRYNSTGTTFSLQLLLYLLFPLKKCLNSFEKVADKENAESFEKWRTTVAKLDVESLLEDIRRMLQEESDIKNTIISSIGIDNEYNENSIVEAVRLFIVGKDAA